VRRYATGLQLVLLVCAGAASGYLWRAALHPRSTIASELAPYRQDLTWPFIKPPATDSPPQARARAHARRSVQARTQPSSGSSAVTGHVPNSSAELAASTTPKQTVAGSKPTPSLPRTPKPQTSPGPKSPPPPPPPSPPSPPSPPPTSPPPAPVASAAVQQQVSTNSSTRPGWGKGDRNHDHTGPPGEPGKGKKK